MSNSASSEKFAMENVSKKDHGEELTSFPCIHSVVVSKLLEEIKLDGIRPRVKHEPPTRDYLKENIKAVGKLQQNVKEKTSRNLLQRSPASSAPPTRRGEVPASSRASALAKTSSSACNSISKARTPHSCLVESSEKATSKSTTQKAAIPHTLGFIPPYVKKRKRYLKEEAEKIKENLEKPTVPPGFSLLSNAERLETLDLLKQNKEELEKSLALLPICNDSLRVRRRKEELEKKLAKVEEGLVLFSRPKVFIKNDT